jgi:hypothetical protein
VGPGFLDEAIAFIDAVLADPEFSMLVTVDGKKVKINRIVRAISEPYFTLTLAEEMISILRLRLTGCRQGSMRVRQPMGCG